MNQNILSLLQSGDKTNIDMALTLMQSQETEIDFVPFKSIETWLKYNTEIFFMQETIPERIAYLFRRQDIYIVGQFLGYVPGEIGILQHLVTINLSSNQLNELPGAIGGLTNLKILNLSYNCLTTLPDTIQKCTDLKQLDLRENPIDMTELDKIQSLLPGCELIY